MDQEQYINLIASLTTLTVGQKVTNDHLATLNGKVAEQESKINNLLIWQARLEGFGGAINAGWVFLVSLVSGSIGAIFYWLIHK